VTADARADDRDERVVADRTPADPDPRSESDSDTDTDTDTEPRYHVDRYTVTVAGIVLAQAAWLAVLMSGGWFYEADFQNLAAATGRSLNWSYLSESQGGHLDVIGRVVFLLLNRIDPLNYPLTVVLRILGQAYATYLLARLLTVLVGRRVGVLVVLGLFAFSPLMVQSLIYLTPSVNFVISEIFLLWAFQAHVRYELTRDLRYAAATGLAMLAATLVSEQAAVTALVLPLLSFGYLSKGGVGKRLIALLRSWPEWLVIAAPIGAFVAFFLGSGKYHNGRLHTGLHGIAKSVWNEWTLAIVPGMAGGPLHWFSGPAVYFSLADPALWFRLVAALLLAVAVAVSVRRQGFWALTAWAMPFVVSGLGIAVVAVGRYATFGDLIARQFEHAAYSAMPIAVAVVLAFWADGRDSIAARLAGDVPAATSPLPRARAARRRSRRRIVPALVVVALLATSVASSIRYAQRWWQSPARRYVDAVQTHLRALGPRVTLFDTYVSPRLMPIIAEHRRMSDLVGLMDLKGVRVEFDGGDDPRIVDERGHVVPATFFVQSKVDTGGSNPLCNDPLVGTDEHLQVLLPRPRAGEWFVKIEYFEQFPSIAYVQALDGRRRIDPVGGRRVLLADRFGRTYLHLPVSRPTALVVRGATNATRVCITKIELGYPFVKQGA